MNDSNKVLKKADFKKIYGEILTPLGFVYAKTKELCFIRVINNELIHILGIQHKRSHHQVLPFGGIATLYRADLLLNQKYQDMANWLPIACQFWDKSASNSDEIPAGHYQYDPSSSESLQNAIKSALSETQWLILPQLDTVQSLQSFLTYYKKMYHVDMRMPPLPLSPRSTGNFEDDQVICYLLDDPISYAEYLVAVSTLALHEKKALYDASEAQDNFQYLKNSIDKSNRKLIDSVHEFANNPQERQQVLNELERRRKMNLDILRSYGVL